MLHKDRDTKRRPGLDFVLPVKGGARIHAGGIVCLTAEGFAVAARKEAGLSYPCLALESVDNQGGGDGEAIIRVSREAAGFDSLNDVSRKTIGRPVYLEDDHTVAAEAAGRSRAGLLIDFSEGQAWVDFRL